jgi:hypothetical protein
MLTTSFPSATTRVQAVIPSVSTHTRRAAAAAALPLRCRCCYVVNLSLGRHWPSNNPQHGRAARYSGSARFECLGNVCASRALRGKWWPVEYHTLKELKRFYGRMVGIFLCTFFFGCFHSFLPSNRLLRNATDMEHPWPSLHQQYLQQQQLQWERLSERQHQLFAELETKQATVRRNVAAVQADLATETAIAIAEAAASSAVGPHFEQVRA